MGFSVYKWEGFNFGFIIFFRGEEEEEDEEDEDEAEEVEGIIGSSVEADVEGIELWKN